MSYIKNKEKPPLNNTLKKQKINTTFACKRSYLLLHFQLVQMFKSLNWVKPKQVMYQTKTSYVICL